MLTVLTVLLALRPGRMVIRTVRAGAVGVLLVSAFGVLQHVQANYDTAPLDRIVGPRWDTMPEFERWWEAASGGVGPAPSLAAGVMRALCLLLACVRHPALTFSRDQGPADHRPG